MGNVTENRLQKVILLIENDVRTKKEWISECEIVNLAESLKQHNIIFEFKAEVQQEEIAQVQDGILYISDSGPVIRRLLQYGAGVLLLLHDGNRDGDFMGIQYAAEGLEGIDYDYLYHVYLRLTGQPWKILETSRFVVREITVEDVPELYVIYAEPEVTLYTENLYDDIEDELAYTRDYIEKVYGFYGYGIWIIEDKKSGQMIGRAGIEYKEGREGAEIGIVVAKPFWRQGVATEVLEAIFVYAKEELDISSFFAMVEKENESSIALFEKMQFSHIEDEEKDGKIYAIYEKAV